MTSIPSIVLLSEMVALQRATDVTSNNIANSSTTGFKRQGILFETYTAGNNIRQATNFVFDKRTFFDGTVGTISSTGNPLDVALQGDGFFQVQTPQGIQYTRNGAFQINSQGNLVTSNGMAVLDTGGAPILFPDDSRDVSIARDGTISIITGTDVGKTQLGRIAIVKFEDNNAVTALGGSMVTTNQYPIPVESNIAIQGAVENSNVSAVSEITSLIAIQRAYERASGLIDQESDRVRNAIDKLGQTTA